MVSGVDTVAIRKNSKKQIQLSIENVGHTDVSHKCYIDIMKKRLHSIVTYGT